MHTGRILWGLVLLALGGVLLAGQLGVLDAGAVVAGWWPVVVIAAGLLRLAGRPRDVTGATIVVVIGLILLGWRQDLVNLSIVLPIALIAAGLWILFRRGGRRPASLEDRSLDVTAAFGGREVRVASRRFEGGRIVATFGGAEVDLRDAVLPEEGATLTVVAVLGGVELKLPAGWDVQVTGPVVLGGIEERVDPAPAGAPVLRIDATVVLGGIEVATDPRARPPGAADD